MISLLLLYKIFQLFIFMFLGFILVKTKIVNSDDSRVLSKISIYLLIPAIIINSFDIEVTNDIVSGLVTAFVVAFVIHIVLFLIDVCFKRICSVTNVERASVMYSNAGNLIIPIVLFLLGEEWVVYSCAYLSVQLFFIFTHGSWLFSADKKFNFKKIFCNINIIAIVIGIVMMLCRVRLPIVVKDIVSPLGSMIGPVAMLIAGMLAAKVNYGQMLKNKKIYLVLFMRMIFCPLVILLLLVLCKDIPVANIDKILLISFLASIAPVASTVMQFAQINNDNEDYAVTINILSTLICIVTMPAFVGLYSWLCMS